MQNKLRGCCLLTLVARRTGESNSSAGLSPAGIEKYDEGETAGGEMGREGGGIDLNFGTPPPIRSEILSENPRLDEILDRLSASSSGEVMRFELELVAAVMNWDVKENA